MAGSAIGKGARGAATGRLPPIEYSTLALRCPLCNTEFTSEIPLVGEPVGRDTDLRPRYAAVDPLPSLIHTCPSCQYTAYRSGYGVRTEPDADESIVRPGDRPAFVFATPEDEELDDLRRWMRRGEHLAGRSGGDLFGAERYILGAKIYEYLKDEDGVAVADYYLRGSWCARATGEAVLERTCQLEALQRFGRALDDSTVPEGDKSRTTYLVGELARRTGDFPRAVDLFSQLEGNPEPDEEESAYFASLARRQLALSVVKSPVNGLIAEDELELERDEE